LKPTSGYIDYEGSDVFMNYEEVKAKIHLISDQLNLYSHLTVKEHIQLIKSISSTWNEQLEVKLSDNFALSETVKVEQLSNGQLTKLKLLLSLSRMPKVIFIDEVINDLDLNTREYIYEALDNYTYENDSFVFVATNIIEDMERYASNIVIVNEGTIIENDTLDNLKEKHSLNLEGIYKKFNSKDTK
jgi:ABC-2 type transport system ATP-binding protein